jgi:hypothetical protein
MSVNFKALIGVSLSLLLAGPVSARMNANEYGARICHGWMNSSGLAHSPAYPSEYSKCLDNPDGYLPDSSVIAAVKNLRAACGGDVRKFCLPVIDDDQARGACIGAHQDELSKPCVAARETLRRMVDGQ